MKQHKDMREIQSHEVYETHRQNEEEVKEIREEKKKTEKLVTDPLALVVDRKKEKEKHSVRGKSIRV
ncbi:hypothetical protein L6452_02122 [Arctium lappa]|uniref:Uncharacterized protein n=1 Tax=Arctium lappa TaxID=4217 RepID=A0ACB9FIP3_ARCLA|nr:hypothetical protein L6452_02122 [Arctium lappa]